MSKRGWIGRWFCSIVSGKSSDPPLTHLCWPRRAHLQPACLYRVEFHHQISHLKSQDSRSRLYCQTEGNLHHSTYLLGLRPVSHSLHFSPNHGSYIKRPFVVPPRLLCLRILAGIWILSRAELFIGYEDITHWTLIDPIRDFMDEDIKPVKGIEKGIVRE